jgi:hypothetical protein
MITRLKCATLSVAAATLTFALAVAPGFSTLASGNTTAVPTILSTDSLLTTATSVVLRADLNNNGNVLTTVFFNYGPSSAYGSSTPQAHVSTIRGPFQFTYLVSGLSPNTTYHFQFVAWYASPSFGVTTPNVSSSDMTFTTTSAPTPFVGLVQQRLSLPKGGSKGNLNSISCAGSNFCLALGSYFVGTKIHQLTERWNGSSWTSVPSPAVTSTSFLATFNGQLSCASPSACLEVNGNASYQAASERWNGQRWIPLVTPSPSSQSFFRSVSCVNGRSCWAVGCAPCEAPNISRSLIEHWNGVRWSVIRASQPRRSYLTSVSCTSDQNCWSVGGELTQQGIPFSEHWNGRSWTEVAIRGPSNQPSPSEVTCSSPTECWTAGQNVQYDVIDHLVNGAWRPVAAPQGNFGAIACASTTSCWAVGTGRDQTSTSYAFVAIGAHWDGQQWNYVLTTPTSSNLESIACPSATQCLAVGATAGFKIPVVAVSQ